MNPIISLSLIFTSWFSSDCVGENFFLKRSEDFISGLSNICFEMNIKDIKENIQPDLLAKFYLSQRKISSSAGYNFWIDNLSFQNWFNDGGNCCFANVYSPLWNTQNHYSDLGQLSSSDFGIYTMFFGKKEIKDTAIAFTFYGGKSNKFYAISTGKYESTRKVRGLFDITMKIDDFYSKYCTRVLDSIGYSRNCTNTITKNCTEEYGGNHGRTVIRTNDKNVIIIIDPDNRNVHIRDAAFMISLKDALQDNIKILYDEYISKKTSNLDK